MPNVIPPQGWKKRFYCDMEIGCICYIPPTTCDNDECIGNELRNPKENTIEMKNASLSWNTMKRREIDICIYQICFYFVSLLK